jgi:hypothetical protein
MLSVGELFKVEPVQWGYRGDPQLWKELRSKFSCTSLPKDSNELSLMLSHGFEDAVGEPLEYCETALVHRFHTHGMSSGLVSGRFWRNVGFPLIVSRFEELRI